MIIVTILQNALKAFRVLVEAAGWAVLGGWLLALIEHDSSLMTIAGMMTLACMAIAGGQIAGFVKNQNAQIKTDRANAKANQPLPDASPDKPRTATGKRQVATWDQTP